MHTWCHNRTEVAGDNRNIGVAFMSPLVSEDGVCVPDAVQHDAPHALLQTRSDGIGASWCSADPGPSQSLRSALVGRVSNPPLRAEQGDQARDELALTGKNAAQRLVG